jgi:hypothetical protein
MKLLIAAFLVMPAWPALADEPVPQPAQSAADQSGGKEPRPPESWHKRSWEAEPVYETTVTAPRPLREEDPIGEYRQPRWTATRRFPTTRIYVIPEGTVQIEYWNEHKINLEDTDEVRVRSMYETEIGLGHRLQLDFYLETQQEGGWNAPIALSKEKIELRYALAPWGAIPGNPTFYIEYVRQSSGSPVGEAKLLLGGEIAQGWHWGSNLVFERELMGEAKAQEYALTLAVARTVVDERLSLGLEVKGETADEENYRFTFDKWEVLAGPSLQWRPVLPAHVDLVALFGTETEKEGGKTERTPLAQPMLVVGWEF